MVIYMVDPPDELDVTAALPYALEDLEGAA